MCLGPLLSLQASHLSSGLILCPFQLQAAAYNIFTKQFNLPSEPRVATFDGIRTLDPEIGSRSDRNVDQSRIVVAPDPEMLRDEANGEDQQPQGHDLGLSGSL